MTPPFAFHKRAAPDSLRDPVADTVKLLRDLSQLPPDVVGGAVSIGNFDGVHLGHARIIERLLAQARALGGPALVFTFDPHPVELLRPAQAPPPLTWTERKVQLLGELGVDAVLVYPTDRALLDLSAETFFEQVIGQRLAAKVLVEGPNFYFGHDRRGTIEVLRSLCDAANVGLEVVSPVEAAGSTISSSRIRRLLAAGDVAGANQMLGRPYRIRGVVERGAGRGASIGFATANLSRIDTLLPAPGVYAAKVELAGRIWPTAVNLGTNPTFDEAQVKAEAHLIGWSGELYGRTLEVDFAQRLRETAKFPDIDSLRAQLQQDVATTRAVIEGV